LAVVQRGFTVRQRRFTVHPRRGGGRCTAIGGVEPSNGGLGVTRATAGDVTRTETRTEARFTASATIENTCGFASAKPQLSRGLSRDDGDGHVTSQDRTGRDARARGAAAADAHRDVAVDAGVVGTIGIGVQRGRSMR
jgi:hypothetical protein